MKDFGITCVWCNTPAEFRNEFKTEFNEVTDDTSDGLHTFVFSMYHDNSAYTEVVYCVIKNGLVFFFCDTVQYDLILDDKFTVVDFRTIDNNSFIFFNSIFAAGDVHYLGDICCDRGNLYRVFTISSDKMISEISRKYDSDNYPVHDIIRMTDEEVMIATSYFMENQSSTFSKQIDDAKAAGEPFEGIEENPFQDRFFDYGTDQNKTESD